MKVLTSPSSFGKISQTPFDLLTDNGFEYLNNPYGRRLTEDEVIEHAAGCVGIVAGVEPLTARVMDALPDLKVISRVGVGMDSVDLDYAKEKGIIVVNTPNGPTLPVAELAVGVTFALLRKIPMAHANLKQGIWKKEIGNLLQGKVIGIIGLGRIGRKVAEMFRALGNPVIGFDLYPNKEWATANGVEVMEIEDVLGKADIVSLHIPGNSDGSPAFGKTHLELMKESALLINLARGGVVDEESLYSALKNNEIKGAAIDVFVDEPYSGNLLELPNVVLTPHLGSYAKEAKLLMEIDAVQNFLDQIKTI
jgi:D-3-phosphoglycerate dehydrogenase